ncbi:hypothetical protein FIBSPDRAFT_882079 [Athelia psychrophila]|uniref:Sodium/calcium exchanger membrane region domain-containing protein n=1 Tax=Athelia psychrophila TaxID=1759441 RepID=A0A166W3R7_9AGAM|nr:hypothetical protein FIBSPDRAFT_882079 [Fibularhizoctonia sp. CBS 109695]
MNAIPLSASIWPGRIFAELLFNLFVMADTANFGEPSRSPMVHHQGELRGDPLDLPKSESPEVQPSFELQASSVRLTGQPPADPSSQTLSGVFDYSRAATILQPERKLQIAPSTVQAIKSIILSSWLNILLCCIPVSWGLHLSCQYDTITFAFSFLAIISLANLLAFATEELSKNVGQTLAGLLNATALVNRQSVELIVSIIALTQCQLHIVQSSFLGLGSCFFAGGVRFSEQGLGRTASQLNVSLLTLSVFAVVLPGAYHMANGYARGALNCGTEWRINAQHIWWRAQ